MEQDEEAKRIGKATGRQVLGRRESKLQKWETEAMYEEVEPCRHSEDCFHTYNSIFFCINL